MFLKIITSAACLIFTQTCYAAEANTPLNTILKNLAGERGISSQQTPPNVLAKVVYMAVHAAYKSSIQKEDPDSLLLKVMDGYQKNYPNLTTESKNSHFRNLYLLMLATRVACDERGVNKHNIFSLPNGVMQKISALSPQPEFLTGITKEQVEDILETLNFPLAYESVVYDPQKINEESRTYNEPMTYITDRRGAGAGAGGQTVVGVVRPDPRAAMLAAINAKRKD